MQQHDAHGFFHSVPPQQGQQAGPQPGPTPGRGQQGAPTYNFNFGKPGGAGTGAGGGQQGGRGTGGSRVGHGPQGQQGGRRAGGPYSPLADPEFFTNADVRNYCEAARAAFIQLSFDIAMAAEVLNATLQEVPDPEGKPFGSKLRARRVTKRLAKVADDAKDAAKNAAATYAAFQREFSPEMQHNPRAHRSTRRPFDFNG
ncbi:plasmid transfer protein TraA [Streptomyces cinereoruber]|uniref:plasmid transfer protein TraA n=1 Tax=Streptomyces cinereoruber TaxID=67260 RepID=UPI0036AD2EEF